MTKTVFMFIRVVITTCAVVTGVFVLNRFEYITSSNNFNNIDNIVGIIPVAMVLVAVAGVTFLLFAMHIKKLFIVSSSAFLLVILSVVLFPTALRGNWWINPTTSSTSEATPDLTVYAPFTKNSQAAKLSTKSELLLSDDLPVLDGATALYPLYAAFAEAVYDENFFLDDMVLCTNTRNAYEAITLGERDIIFVAGASAQQVAAATATGADLHFTPIGHEAFVFLVGKENPLDNITYQQLRNIYSGKTAYWRTLGWREGGRIIAYQRPEGSGSQTGLQKMVMDNLPIQAPQPLPDTSLIGTNSLMKQVSVVWQGVQPSIGYSYRFYATAMYANPDTKLLSINGVEPTIQNIQSGRYPFVGDFYAVTNGAPSGNIKLLIDWILSPQGQEIVKKTGYVPLSGGLITK